MCGHNGVVVHTAQVVGAIQADDDGCPNRTGCTATSAGHCYQPCSCACRGSVVHTQCARGPCVGQSFAAPMPEPSQQPSWRPLVSKIDRSDVMMVALCWLSLVALIPSGRLQHGVGHLQLCCLARHVLGRASQRITRSSAQAGCGSRGLRATRAPE